VKQITSENVGKAINHINNINTRKVKLDILLYFHLENFLIVFLFNNQQDTLIIQIYSVMKFYMFRASSLHIIRSFLLYIRHW